MSDYERITTVFYRMGDPECKHEMQENVENGATIFKCKKCDYSHASASPNSPEDLKLRKALKIPPWE